MQVNGVQALPRALQAGLERRVRIFPPHGFFAALLGVELRQLQSGAEATLAPAVLGIEREQARVELWETGTAVRTGALGRENGGVGFCSGLGAHVNHATSVLQA